MDTICDAAGDGGCCDGSSGNCGWNISSRTSTNTSAAAARRRTNASADDAAVSCKGATLTMMNVGSMIKDSPSGSDAGVLDSPVAAASMAPALGAAAALVFVDATGRTGPDIPDAGLSSPVVSAAHALPRSALGSDSVDSSDVRHVLVTVPGTLRVDLSAEALAEAYHLIGATSPTDSFAPLSSTFLLLPGPSPVGDDGTVAAARVSSPAPPRSRTRLLSLCLDAFTLVAGFCPDADVLALGAASTTLRSALSAVEDAVWRPRAQCLWAEKHIFAAAALGRLTLPRAVVTALMRATAVTEPPVPEGLCVGLAHSWRAAYFVSKRDARRDFLTDDELMDGDWQVVFTAPGAPAVGVPPLDGSGPRIFQRMGRVKVVQPLPNMPAMPCQLFRGGRRFQADVHPAHAVLRRPDWGWSIVNDFVRFESVTVYPPPTPPESPASPRTPQPEPDSFLLSRGPAEPARGAEFGIMLHGVSRAIT